MNIRKNLLTASFVVMTVTGCATQTSTPTTVPEDAAAIPELPGITVITQKNSAATETTNAPEVSPETLQSLPAGTDIIIRPGEDRTIHEYRVNGQLYSIKVVPKVGPPYYLVAVDTAGNFMRSDRPQMLIPSWKVLEW
ncbi:DUF2782 domain-containing protein [Parendozoicomonas haliclonae]|uniref:DUF2782 domain-containing protein n=1 Tax=Parendozoicomonas haliclonae TaxID=1960125 RepID=A0A1X7AJY1_9GAMM|nr:DUF2782 domain-containing protein [Parendozoicomonas haliclonae]SMA46238.1 hypothetical protein EHSB41UT_02108 [Parendozoicomonas haliclonae]